MPIKLANPTKEQLNIYAAFERAKAKEEPSFAVDAKAGSGKTSTAVASVDAFPVNSAMVAFNKSIAYELVERLGGRVPASTFHSLGFSMLRERIAGCRSDLYKISDLCRNKFKWGFMYRPYANVIEHMMTNGIGIENEGDLYMESAYLDAMGFSDTALPDGLDLMTFLGRCQELMFATLEDNHRVCFPEMLYKPLFLAKRHKWKLEKYGTLIIDEAQDVSKVRLMLAGQAAKNLIPIGDPCQSIYGFAGAVTGAFDVMCSQYDMNRYTLSTSWRCSRAVILEAQNIIGPVIHARENAEQGHVGYLSQQEFWPMPSDENDFILCRTNAPLFKLAMQYIKQSRPFQLRSDFVESLMALAKRLAKESRGKATMSEAINEWRKEQIETYKDAKGVVRRIEEQADCLQTVLNTSSSVEDMIFNLEMLLNSEYGPVMMTIHKAKGLEAKRVFLIRPDFLPAPWVDSENEAEMEQERNLHYVAVTRAISEFYYVEGE